MQNFNVQDQSLQALLPKRSEVSLVDVVHDDGGNGHDLSWPSRHQGHGAHRENQNTTRRPQNLLCNKRRNQTCKESMWEFISFIFFSKLPIL